MFTEDLAGNVIVGLFIVGYFVLKVVEVKVRGSSAEEPQDGQNWLILVMGADFRQHSLPCHSIIICLSLLL